MKTKLNLWLTRDLTLYGKTLLAKTIGISQLIYTASMLTIPESVIKNTQAHLSEKYAFSICVKFQRLKTAS